MGSIVQAACVSASVVFTGSWCVIDLLCVCVFFVFVFFFVMGPIITDMQYSHYQSREKSIHSIVTVYGLLLL